MVGLIIRIILATEGFFLSIIVFKILPEKCKKTKTKKQKKKLIFLLSRAITFIRSCLTLLCLKAFVILK